jgi:hypothetical protein
MGMTLDDILHDFATAGHTLPEASMRWALEHWDEAGPRFVDLLERYASGEDRSERTKEALFFALHLLGEKGEAAAVPALCQLIRDPEAIEELLGDGLTETLPGIIISTFDGQPHALKEVIEAPAVDDVVRSAALDAMAYFTRAGDIPARETRAYLLHLLGNMQPQASCFVWAGWVDAVSLLGYEDYAEKAEQLIRRGFVPHRVMSVKSFRAELRRTLADPPGMAAFERNRIGPFRDAVGTLSTWYAFSPQYAADAAARAARREELAAVADADEDGEMFASDVIDEPYRNPLRSVGRNDPCPCGSGKKYKKCCLK